MQRTRSSSCHSVFGQSLSELPKNELPTCLQVCKYSLFLKENKYRSNKDIVSELAETVIEIWNRASIPSQSLKNVKIKLLRLLEEGSQATRHGKQNERSMFEEDLDKLFDIAACQCKEFAECQCSKDSKVPQREQDFLTDQRTTRLMRIGVVDVKVTQMMNRKKFREDRMKEREEEEMQRKKKKNEAVSSVDTSEPDDTDLNSSGEMVEDEWTQPEKNMTPIPTVALQADRYGISNAAAAAISTATLVDYAIISPDDKNNIIDPNKVYRARKMLRCKLKEATVDEDTVAIFFDGRKDQTLEKEKVGNKYYGQTRTEDHYVLVGEPGTSYLRHLTIEQGTGAAIADGIYKALQDMEIESKIFAVGADSTPVNTGRKNGAIHLLESRLGRPVQWLICSLHLNELPLRHLCKKLIGPSESATQWKGPISNALSSCETLPRSPSGFKKIDNGDPLPNIDVEELSCDQSYLYQIISAIRTGYIDDDLLRQKPGPMLLSRWLTTANRICRLYISSDRPSDELLTLTQFIVCHYGPMWFTIKRSWKCTDGPKHLLDQILKLRLLPSNIVHTVWPVIARNSYWAHHENVLLAMLADEDRENRETAINIIKEIRLRETSTSQCVREFLTPRISQNAETLKDLLPTNITFEPPLTMNLTIEELDNIIKVPLDIQIPCHSQGVERCVKLVTEASSAVYGEDARDGFIKARIKSRSFMPSFKSKQDFSVV